MCGIAGSLNLATGTDPMDRPALEAMVGAISHRGPDEFGLYRDEHAALGHARLSIIDLATGQQPMTNEDGSLWIVFNGEIFNYVELRDELERLGHVHRTRSDTEVILHAWEAWGRDAFARFDGQFALAIWDTASRTLVLARDRLGVRPLYLCEHGGRLLFASEVKAIFAADPTIPRAFDPIGLAETFTFWASVAPQGVFEGITELEPGHVRTVSPERTSDAPYWLPDHTPDLAITSLDEAVERVRASLERAVSLRMLRADVPVGSYLSGGLDSSLIAALGRAATTGPFRTYSIRFADEEFDETAYQRQMAARLDADHHEILVTRRDIADSFPDVIEHAERPLLRTAPAPLYLLSRLVRDSGIKVVLTGEGADEMFAGYDLFREARIRRFWGRQPDSAIRPALLERLYPYLARSPVTQRAMAREFFGRDRERWASPGFGHAPRWRSTSALQQLFARPLLDVIADVHVSARLLASAPHAFATWSTLAQDQYLEVRTLLSGYLLSSQGDRMLMAHSVEGRFPFLDTEVVAVADALPDRYKLRGLDEKHVLKRVASGIVPDDIIRRPKQPYRAPDAVAFIGPDAPAWVEDVLDPRAVSEVGVFDPAAVSRLWRKVGATEGRVQPSNSDNMALVGVVSTALVHERILRRVVHRSTPPVFRTIVDRVREPVMTAPSLP